MRANALTLALLVLGLVQASAQIPTLTNLWSVSLNDTSDSSPAIAPDGTIYLGTFEGKLWAITDKGRPKWTFRAGREIKSSPAVGPDGTIYFGSRDHKFYAVTAEGKKKWEFQTGAWVDSSPAVDDDSTVYFGSWDANFYALKADGSKKWQFRTGGPIVSSPAITPQGKIVFGSHDRKLYALGRDGAKAWEYATGGAIISSPAVDGESSVYFTSTDGSLYSLDPKGALRWRLKTGGITESSPALGPDGTVYVGVNNKLCAVSPEGKLWWERWVTWDNTARPVDASPLVLVDDTVCVISREGFLTAMDQEKRSVWGMWMGAHGWPAVAEDGTLYAIGTAEKTIGTVVALRSNVPLARSPWPKFRGNPQNTGRLYTGPKPE
jgi:outer membrane protein assembly factor BamB